MNRARSLSRWWSGSLAIALVFSAACLGRAEISVPAGAAALQEALVNVAHSIMPSVVNVITEERPQPARGGNNPFEDFFRRFPRGRGNPFEAPQRPPAEGLGTGIVVGADGYILTNHHVIENVDKITVVFNAEEDNPDEFEAQVVQFDEESDLAVLKIEKTGLPAVEFGDSESLRVGDMVIAVGSPFRFHHSVSLGIVSAKGRHLRMPDGTRSFQDYIQTDASINRGNSGGPLVNLKGQVVGINTAIFTPSGGNVGVGFAVPSKTVMSVLPSLLRGEKIVRGYLGVLFQPIQPEVAEFYGVKNGFEVVQVLEDGPAQRAGVEDGDVIVSFNGRTPTDSEDFRRMVGQSPVGKPLPLVVMRGAEKKTLMIKLGERPSESKPVKTARVKSRLGLTVEDLSDEAIEALDLPKDVTGVLITRVEPDSPADRARPRIIPGRTVLRAIIYSPRQHPVEIRSVDDFRREERKLKPGQKFLIKCMTQGQRTQHHFIRMSEEPANEDDENK